MVPADIHALLGDVPKSEKGVGAQDDTETAYDSEGDGKLAGDGEIFEPVHADALSKAILWVHRHKAVGLEYLRDGLAGKMKNELVGRAGFVPHPFRVFCGMGGMQRYISLMPDL
jgi:hypothetical protein